MASDFDGAVQRVNQITSELQSMLAEIPSMDAAELEAATQRTMAFHDELRRIEETVPSQGRGRTPNDLGEALYTANQTLMKAYGAIRDRAKKIEADLREAAEKAREGMEEWKRLLEPSPIVQPIPKDMPF